MGITGTWEGYVPTATDLYYKGVNPLVFTNISDSETEVKFETTYIYMRSTTQYGNAIYLKASKTFNFAAYTKITFELTVTEKGYSGYPPFVLLNRDNKNVDNKLMEVSFGDSLTLGNKTVTIDISNYRTTFIPVFGFVLRHGTANLNRIRVA